MKKFNFKSGLCGFMAGVIVATAVPVMAYNGSMNILATFKNIKIYIDGAELTPRDTVGNVLEPFIYNGSTYLPIRAVGEAVGKNVSYDANTNSVYLGSNENSGSPTSQGTELEPYQFEGTSIGDTTMGGVNYKNALRFDQGGGVGTEGSAYYNLGGAYTSVSGVYGGIDNTGETGVNAVIKFYGDGILLNELSINYGDLPKNFTLNVTGVSQLVVEMETEVYWFKIGIGDMYFK